MKFKIPALSGLLLGSAIAAQAEWTVKQFNERKNDRNPEMRDLAAIYVGAVALGMSYASLAPGREPLFCERPPVTGRQRTPRDYVDILTRYIENHKTESRLQPIDEFPIEPLLLAALMEAFPCPNNK